MAGFQARRPDLACEKNIALAVARGHCLRACGRRGKQSDSGIGDVEHLPCPDFRKSGSCKCDKSCAPAHAAIAPSGAMPAVSGQPPTPSLESPHSLDPRPSRALPRWRAPARGVPRDSAQKAVHYLRPSAVLTSGIPWSTKHPCVREHVFSNGKRVGGLRFACWSFLGPQAG